MLALRGKQGFMKVRVNEKYHGRGACKALRRVLVQELIDEHLLMEIPPTWRRAKIYAVLPTKRVAR